MTDIILKEYTEIFEKIKEHFENKNYDKAFELAKELVEKNISNEYLYQMITTIYYINKDYEKAIKFSELCINKYGGHVNDDNLLKIMINIINDPEYDLSKEYFKSHIIKMINNQNCKIK